jgi:very-short-patch-repair endonuclease
MPANALFSGRTAAWLHGMDYPWEPIEVTLPQRSQTSHLEGVRLWRSDYTETDCCQVRELRTTSRTRTVADMARRAQVIEAVPIIDMALRSHGVNLEELQRWIEDHGRHRGIGRLGKALDLADPRSESPMESRLRALLVTAGLPKPKVQQSVTDSAGLFLARVDLSYPSERLVIEYDGATHRERLASDNDRQNRLIDAGYSVLRFTAGDVLHRPAAVVDKVRRLLSRYSRGSPN